MKSVTHLLDEYTALTGETGRDRLHSQRSPRARGEFWWRMRLRVKSQKLLRGWRAGERSASDALLPLVYDELRRLAHHHLRNERPHHTLQSTALVNEA